MQSVDHGVQEVEADSVKNDSKYNARFARSPHTTTSPVTRYDEQIFESLCLDFDLYPDEYPILPLTPEPWPPFGQPSLAVGRTPPQGIST